MPGGGGRTRRQFSMPEFIGELEFRNQPPGGPPRIVFRQHQPLDLCIGNKPRRRCLFRVGMDGRRRLRQWNDQPVSHDAEPQQIPVARSVGHGARINASPWRASETPEFNIHGEILRFFDEHLIGIDTGLRAEKPIHYFTVHEERWRAADAWPPIPEATRYFLAERHARPSGFTVRPGQRSRHLRRGFQHANRSVHAL